MSFPPHVLRDWVQRQGVARYSVLLAAGRSDAEVARLTENLWTRLSVLPDLEVVLEFLLPACLPACLRAFVRAKAGMRAGTHMRVRAHASPNAHARACFCEHGSCVRVGVLGCVLAGPT